MFMAWLRRASSGTRGSCTVMKRRSISAWACPTVASSGRRMPRTPNDASTPARPPSTASHIAVFRLPSQS